MANDELDLAIPIWDTDLTFLTSSVPGAYSMVTCTAYGDVREYDTRDGRRKAVINNKIVPKG